MKLNGHKNRIDSDVVLHVSVLAQSCIGRAKWDTSSGPIVLQQSDNTVTGSGGNLQIQGTVSDNHLVASWKSADATGTLDFTMATDCQSFSGNWRCGTAGEWTGDWTGTRVEVEVT